MLIRASWFAAAARAHAALRGAVGRPWFWIALVGAMFGAPVALSLRPRSVEPPQMFSRIPPFALVDQDGEPFSEATMRGHVWVADFIFTRCPTACPRLTTRMEWLQKHLRGLLGTVRLVSFSVDPQHDTPARLREYARGWHVNPRVWSFVTGDGAAMERAVVQGFKISMGKDSRIADDVLSVFHGERFVLVDRDLRVRGYYDAADDREMDRLLRDAAHLVNFEAPPPSERGPALP